MMSLPPIVLSPIEEEEEGLEWLDEENDLIKPIHHDGHLHVSPPCESSQSQSRPPLAPLSHHSILSRHQSYADIQNIKHTQDTQHIKAHVHDTQHIKSIHDTQHIKSTHDTQHGMKQQHHVEKISSQILSDKCHTKHVKPLQLDIIPVVEISAYHPRASRPLSASHLYHLRHTEHQYRPTQPLPSHHLQHRPQLIRWLCDVTQRYGITSITLHLSIYYLDRLLMGWDPSPKRLHLLASVCLWIACKLEEREEHIISLHALAHETRQAYPLEWLREMEKIVLVRLEWSLMMVTPVHFLDLYVMMMEQHHHTSNITNVDMISSRSLSSSPIIGMTSPSSFNDMMSPSSTSSISYMSSPTSSFDLSTSTSPSPRSFHSYITLFTDLSLHDYTYQRYLPSILAASILACARHATGMELWNDEMVEMTTCEQEEIMMPFQQLYGSYLRLYPEAAYRSPSPEFQLSSSDMTD